MNRKLAFLIILCGIAIGATGLVNAQDLNISSPPLEWLQLDPPWYTPMIATYDYGNVVLGESETTTFRLDSIASSDVSVYIIWLVDSAPYIYPDPYADPEREPYLYCWESFCFNPATYPHTPNIMPPGQYRLVDVTFTPVSLGEQSVYLYIRSNDAYPPPGSVAFIKLVGTGVSGPPEEEIEYIQEFFDHAVTSGELVGVGPTEHSAAGKLIALENMLEQAEYLIDTGDIPGACVQLHSAYEKTDGILLPPDFVTGMAAEELAALIQDVMSSLGCA
ncbi:MAG TPA: hypothetical protein PLV96_05665 [Methanoregulaceae archaeon]|nr:hypothetical protein [Methanoregulaceae archaeon]